MISMDIKKKAAQLVMPRIDGHRLEDAVYVQELLHLIHAGVGGFIVFGGRIPETVAALENLRDQAGSQVLFSADIERGLGQQLTGGTNVPNQRAIASAIRVDNPADVSLLRDMLAVIRKECLAAGIDMVFAPVADVNINPDNPIICTRSFGESPELVANLVDEFVCGYQGDVPGYIRPDAPSAGLVACAKHFPGHGDTSTDSHKSLPVIEADRSRLDEVELKPFRAAIKAGVKSIMVGHLMVPALESEPVPATFSKRIVTELLRNEMGFDGLVVTDALDMGALKGMCCEEEAAVRALAAGCDVLLHPSRPLEVAAAIARAVEEGRIQEHVLDTSCHRLARIRMPHGKRNYAGFEIGSQVAEQIRDRIAYKSVHFRRQYRSRPSGNVTCIIVDDDGGLNTGSSLIQALRNKYSSLRVLDDPSQIRSDDCLIIGVFSKVSAWKGSSGLTEHSSEKIIQALSRAASSFIISFGSPYILDQFRVDTMIEAYDPSDFMQRAVVDRMFA